MEKQIELPETTVTTWKNSLGDPMRLDRDEHVYRWCSIRVRWVPENLGVGHSMTGHILSLTTQLQQMREALEPFAQFADWITTAVEAGIIKVDEHTVICQLQAGGGSDAMRFGDFLKARAALATQGGS